MPDHEFRFTDAQMAQFIAHGYITIAPDLPPEFHAEVFEKHQQVFAKEGNPGNNLLPRIPLVRQVFDDSTVVGALKSVAGDDYYLQPHRHPHFNKAHSDGQSMHQDGGKRWSHRTRYLLAFYYPQDTPLERGPSGIVPGSHYFNTPAGARISEEVPLTTPAGTVTIVDYDLWHRAMPNISDDNRYMIKFLFARMSEPTAPAWHNQHADWPGSAMALPGDEPELQRMYAHAWSWHRGESPGTVSSPNGHTPTALFNNLVSDRERTALAAAYDLAAFGAEVVPGLIDHLNDDCEMVRRHAAYALSNIGGPAVAALTDTLAHVAAVARADAATILGDIGPTASAALPALIAACKDPHQEVRRCAAEALGTVGQDSPIAVPALIESLCDTEGQIRQVATLALCRIGHHAAEAITALEKLLDDENRYVRADALYALKRIGTTRAKDTLIRHLMPARWCPITTPESTF